jgi:hypothetical protein
MLQVFFYEVPIYHSDYQILMIDDLQLMFGVNMVGMLIFALVILYHYISVNEKTRERSPNE